MSIIYVVSASYHYETNIIGAFYNEKDAKKLVAHLIKEGKKDLTFNQASYEKVEIQ